MRTKKDTLEIIQILEENYPLSECGLVHKSAWELLVAVRLSAQCTDKRVNVITPLIFSKYPTCFDMAKADLQDIVQLVKPCGFYNGKAKDILLTSQILANDFNGVVPDEMEALLKLPGVGRKSANLILGDIYNKPSVVIADTHCIRISNRLGFIKSKDPVKVEFALRKVLPPDKSNDYCHRMVLHGRDVCTARKAHCDICCINSLCPKIGIL